MSDLVVILNLYGAMALVFATVYACAWIAMNAGRPTAESIARGLLLAGKIRASVPDFSPEFVEWVSKNPKVRQLVLDAANAARTEAKR